MPANIARSVLVAIVSSLVLGAAPAGTPRIQTLVDCTSFVVMTDRKIQDALTADHHFERAGFNALLK
jgi:hypothetical protein